MSDIKNVRLAPPGAGIPVIERFIGGAMLSLRRWRRSRLQLAADFEREREAISRLYSGHAVDTLSRRELIPRLRGLEDSSRYWSILMTLDHLRIVNDQIARVVSELAAGRVPQGTANTAAVKPSTDVGPEVISAYESACDGFKSTVASQGDLRTRARYAHPWFGLLDAAGWQAMAAMHMGIHRNQIARILENTHDGADQA